MPTKPKNQTSRRAAGKTQTSISLSTEALNKARALAQADNRTLSNYLEKLIRGIN